MKFEIDNLTIQDLELYDKVRGEKSVFSIFNNTKSIGGRRKLETMFANPFTEIELINQRIETIKGFLEYGVDFVVDRESLDFIEFYLLQQNVPSGYSYIDSYINYLSYRIKPKNEFYIIERGIRYLIDILNILYDFSKNISGNSDFNYLKSSKFLIIESIENSALKVVIGLNKRKSLLPHEIGNLDYVFRKLELNRIRTLLDLVYEIDVYTSVSVAANQHGLCLPAISNGTNYFNAQDIFHPFIDNPISNDILIGNGKNICFLTGPNMAGKSTFLKAMGICVYLSHLGFPVPAKSLKIAVFKGLFTTINLPDNINKGYSHFYSEVLRVKYVADRINQLGDVFVIFDELFRGTNVKDAYEASLSVITAFSQINKSVFAISTHIVEVAETLKDNKSIFFKCFTANLVHNVPQFNYKMVEGVTNERIGLYILKKEGVVELIEKSIGGP